MASQLSEVVKVTYLSGVSIIYDKAPDRCCEDIVVVAIANAKAPISIINLLPLSINPRIVSNL